MRQIGLVLLLVATSILAVYTLLRWKTQEEVNELLVRRLALSEESQWVFYRRALTAFREESATATQPIEE